MKICTCCFHGLLLYAALLSCATHNHLKAFVVVAFDLPVKDFLSRRRSRQPVTGGGSPPNPEESLAAPAPPSDVLVVPPFGVTTPEADFAFSGPSAPLAFRPIPPTYDDDGETAGRIYSRKGERRHLLAPLDQPTTHFHEPSWTPPSSPITLGDHPEDSQPPSSPQTEGPRYGKMPRQLGRPLRRVAFSSPDLTSASRPTSSDISERAGEGMGRSASEHLSIRSAPFSSRLPPQDDPDGLTTINRSRGRSFEFLPSPAEALLMDVASSKTPIPEGLQGLSVWPPTKTIVDPSMYVPGGEFRIWGARERRSYAIDLTSPSSATLAQADYKKQHFIYPLQQPSESATGVNQMSEDELKNLVGEGPLIKVPAGQSLTAGDIMEFVLKKKCFSAVTRPIFESYGLPITLFNTRTKSSSPLSFSPPFALGNRGRQPEDIPLPEDQEPEILRKDDELVQEKEKKDEISSSHMKQQHETPAHHRAYSLADHVELRLPMLSSQRAWLEDLYQSMSMKRMNDRLVRGGREEAKGRNVSRLSSPSPIPPTSPYDDFTAIQLRPPLSPNTILQALPTWGSSRGDAYSGSSSLNDGADRNALDLFVVHQGKECLNGLRETAQLDHKNLVSLWSGFVVHFSISLQGDQASSVSSVRQAIRTASQSATLQDACSLISHHLGIQITAARDPTRFQCQFFQERLPPPPSTSSDNVSEVDGRPKLFPLDPATLLVDVSTASIRRPIRLELTTQTEKDKKGLGALFQAFEKARNPLASLVFPRSPLAVDLWIYVGTKRLGVRDLSSHGETKAKAVVTLLIENPLEPVQSILTHFVAMFPRSIQKCFAVEGGPMLKMKTSDAVTRPSRRLSQYDEGLDENWLVDPRLVARYLPTSKFRFTLTTKKEKHKHFWRKTARLAQTQCLTQLDTPSKDFLRQSIVNASLGGGLPVYIEKGVALQIHSLKTSKPVAHIKVVGDHILTSTVLDLMTGLKKMLEESTRKCLERNPIELRWLDMKRSGGKSKKRGIGGANWNAFPIGSGVNTLQFLAQQQWNSLYALAFAFVGVRFRAQRRAAFLLNRWLPETFGGSRGEPWDCLRRDPLFIYAQKSPNFTVVVRVD